MRTWLLVFFPCGNAHDGKVQGGLRGPALSWLRTPQCPLPLLGPLPRPLLARGAGSAGLAGGQQQVLYQALDLYLDLCLQEGQELQYQQEVQEEHGTDFLCGL